MFNKVKIWVKKHRKGIIVTASVIVIVGSTVFLILNGKKVKMPVAEVAAKMIPESLNVPADVTEGISMVTIDVDGVTKTFLRTEFIRQLPEGQNASQAKIVQAAELGIPLNPGETLVNACTVNMKMSA